MSRGAKLVLGLVVFWLAAWSAWVIARGVTSKSRGDLPTFHDPEGYRETAELYLRHGWLQYDADRQRISLDPEKVGTPIEELYLRSHLARDVRDFNEGERSIFSIENQQIFGIDPSRHRIALPFSETRSWLGALTYRPTPTRLAELRGGGTAIQFYGPTRDLRAYEDPPEVTLRAGGDDGTTGDAANQRARRVEKVKLSGRGGVFLGTANRAGDALIFTNRSQTAGVTVSVSGDEIPRGHLRRLDSGDLLKLRWPLGSRGSQYALLWTSVLGAAPPISVHRPINGRARRIPASPDPPIAANILSGLDSALGREPSADLPAPLPEAERFDLALSLDSSLQADIQRELEAYTAKLRGPNEAPFRAAVTVMDANNGELLALASTPTAATLGDWGDGDRSRERWLRNHNFSRLPIGSVAKVPFAAAILDASPFLADLKIRGYGPSQFEQLLGIALEPPLEDHAIGGGEDGWIDFEEFLEHSSNKYGAALLTLAAAVDETGQQLLPPAADPDIPETLDPEERFALGGTVYDRRPRLRLALEPFSAAEIAKKPERARLARTDKAITLEHLPMATSLWKLFDLPYTTKPRSERWPAGAGDDLIDTSIWRPVLTHLYGEELPRTSTFRGASPERENLALNLIEDYRRKVLSLVLGGGESTWTMPRIASVFARLATGKKIEPRLVHALTPHGEDESASEGSNATRARTANGKTKAAPLPPLPLEPRLRQRFVDALTRVAGPNGTASALAPRLRALDQKMAARGKVLGFFSKTGSPDNERYVSDRLARALDALIRTRALTLDGSDRIVYRDAGPVDAERTEEGRPSRSRLALEANTADRALLRRYSATVGQVIQACDTWNDSRPEDRKQFERRNGRLVRSLRRTPYDRVGAAYVFTIGVWDGAARRASASGGIPNVDVVAHSPERALTVAIVIEEQGKEPTIAVPFAERLLREILPEALDNGW